MDKVFKGGGLKNKYKRVVFKMGGGLEGVGLSQDLVFKFRNYFIR